MDPDTCELKFLNARARTLAPEVQEGMPCYALMGRTNRCPDCPALAAREKGSAIVYNERLKLRVPVEATYMQWKGKGAWMLSCRQKERL